MTSSIPGAREIGTKEARLTVASADDRFTDGLDRALAIARGDAGHLLVTGTSGTGKATLRSVVVAMCDLRGARPILVNSNEDLGGAIAELRRSADRVLVAELPGDMSISSRRAILEAGISSRACVLTATHLHALERHLVRPYRKVDLLPPESIPAQVLAVADIVWVERLGMTLPLSDGLVEDARAALVRGPFPTGYCSVVTLVEMLSERLALGGAVQDASLTRAIDVSDVNGALVEMFRAEVPPVPPSPRRLVILVEGDTDAVYLKRAAELCNAEWTAELLKGCDVEAAGGGREGGATKAVPKLAALSQDNDAIALFDYDEMGRRGLRQARELGFNAMTLPREFGRANHEPDVEVEDLLPLDMLQSFYAEHPGASAEQKYVSGDDEVVRIVVKGEDKQLVADFFANRANFRDAERLAYVTCALWHMLKLPLPPGPAENMGEWLRGLQGRW